MKKIISVKLAGNLLLIFLGLLLVFHILVLSGILPASVIWGGQANSNNLVVLESIALVVTVLFLIIVAAKLGYILPGKFSGASHSRLMDHLCLLNSQYTGESGFRRFYREFGFCSAHPARGVFCTETGHREISVPSPGILTA